MSLELEELYQEVILDHSRRPRNFGDLADAAVRVHGDNPACGDEIHLGVKFGPDGELQEINFTGHGCEISQASASLMTMKLKGKSRAEAVGRRSDYFDRNRFCRAATPWFAKLGGAYWKERCLTRCNISVRDSSFSQSHL